MNEILIKSVDSVVSERWYASKIYCNTDKKCQYPAQKTYSIAFTKYEDYDPHLSYLYH